MKFKRHVGEQEEDTNLWIGYCAFHLGDYKRAFETNNCCKHLIARKGNGYVIFNRKKSETSAL